MIRMLCRGACHNMYKARSNGSRVMPLLFLYILSSCFKWGYTHYSSVISLVCLAWFLYCYFCLTGLQFRLGGGGENHGRVEMNYNGVWGSICDWLWDSRDARVFCKNLNYVDGLEVVGARYGHMEGPLWFTRVSCTGEEKSILQCRHTGFNSSDEMEGVYAGLCRTRSHDAAARCFNRKLGNSISTITLFYNIDHINSICHTVLTSDFCCRTRGNLDICTFSFLFLPYHTMRRTNAEFDHFHYN